MQDAKTETQYISWLEDLSSKDVDQVGGKNASLGEMIRELKKKSKPISWRPSCR